MASKLIETKHFCDHLTLFAAFSSLFILILLFHVFWHAFSTKRLIRHVEHRLRKVLFAKVGVHQLLYLLEGVLQGAIFFLLLIIRALGFHIRLSEHVFLAAVIFFIFDYELSR